MDRINFNRSVKMHEVCEKKVIEGYPDCICFKDGNAYVTNRHLLVCNKIDEICNFELEQRDLLEGKALPPDSYKKILEYEKAVITEDGIECVDEKKGKSFFEFYAPEQIDGQPPKEMPNFESVFSEQKAKLISSADRLAMNLDFLSKIKNSLYSEDNGYVVSYYESALIVKPVNEFCSGRALLMLITF